MFKKILLPLLFLITMLIIVTILQFIWNGKNTKLNINIIEINGDS